MTRRSESCQSVSSSVMLVVLVATVCLCPLAMVSASATSCSIYCTQQYLQPSDRTLCIDGCVLGYQITQLSQCVCNSSACALGCSRVVRCSRCAEGGCDTSEDATGFLCTVPKSSPSQQAAAQSGSTDPASSASSSSGAAGSSPLAIAAYVVVAVVAMAVIIALLVIHRKKKNEDEAGAAAPAKKPLYEFAMFRPPMYQKDGHDYYFAKRYSPNTSQANVNVRTLADYDNIRSLSPSAGPSGISGASMPYDNLQRNKGPAVKPGSPEHQYVSLEEMQHQLIDPPSEFTIFAQLPDSGMYAKTKKNNSGSRKSRTSSAGESVVDVVPPAPAPAPAPVAAANSADPADSADAQNPPPLPTRTGAAAASAAAAAAAAAGASRSRANSHSSSHTPMFKGSSSSAALLEDAEEEAAVATAAETVVPNATKRLSQVSVNGNNNSNNNSNNNNDDSADSKVNAKSVNGAVYTSVTTTAAAPSSPQIGSDYRDMAESRRSSAATALEKRRSSHLLGYDNMTSAAGVHSIEGEVLLLPTSVTQPEEAAAQTKYVQRADAVLSLHSDVLTTGEMETIFAGQRGAAETASSLGSQVSAPGGMTLAAGTTPFPAAGGNTAEGAISTGGSSDDVSCGPNASSLGPSTVRKGKTQTKDQTLLSGRSGSPTVSVFTGLSMVAPRKEAGFHANPQALSATDAEQPWFHSLLSKADAGDLLRRAARSLPQGARDGLFLVREEAHAPMDDRVVLCVFLDGVVSEYRIIYNQCRYSLAPFSDAADSVSKYMTLQLSSQAVYARAFVSVTELLRFYHSSGSRPMLTACVDRASR